MGFTPASVQGGKNGGLYKAAQEHQASGEAGGLPQKLQAQGFLA